MWQMFCFWTLHMLSLSVLVSSKKLDSDEHFLEFWVPRAEITLDCDNRSSNDTLLWLLYFMSFNLIPSVRSSVIDSFNIKEAN